MAKLTKACEGLLRGMVNSKRGSIVSSRGNAALRWLLAQGYAAEVTGQGPRSEWFGAKFAATEAGRQALAAAAPTSEPSS